jgi:iron-sulfur cluster assembly protein
MNMGRIEDPLVSMTERAVDKAIALLRERGGEEPQLRVFVAGGGCSGYQYGMAVAQGREEGDTIIEQSGLTLLVDPESVPLIRGAEIDYIDDVMRSGFSISNPNAASTCGCGSSFQTGEGGGQPKSCC